MEQLAYHAKEIKIWGIILLAMGIFVVSCNKNTIQEQNKNDAHQTSDSSEVHPPQTAQFPMPKIQSVLQESVWRDSDFKETDGGNPPIWKNVKVEIFFHKKPQQGNKVTVIPLKVDIAPMQLKIIKTIEVKDACNEKLPHLWQIELETITQKEFFETKAILNRREEYPFDVCILYPAVEFARSLDIATLKKEMLPKGVFINTITAAVDLTNDREPDILIVQYCCGEPHKPREECDYTCGKIFAKSHSAWKLIDTSAPC